MNEVEACFVRTNGKIEKLLVSSLEDYQQAVGGLIEPIGKIGFHDCFGVVIGDEEARCTEKPINMPVTLWLNSHNISQIVHGDILIVGQIPKEEDWSDCPEQVYAQLPKLWHDPEFHVESFETFEDLAEKLGEMFRGEGREL